MPRKPPPSPDLEAALKRAAKETEHSKLLYETHLKIRNDLIVQAIDGGTSRARVAPLVGVNRATVDTIYHKTREGL